MDTRELIIANPAATDAEVVALHNAQSPTPRPGPAYITYLAIGERVDLFGDNAGNVAGTLHDGMEAWIAGTDLSTLNPALPNKGQLTILHQRLGGAVGVDLTSAKTPALLNLFTSGIPGMHEPLLTAEQAAALLSLGYVIPPTIDVAAVQAARLQMVAAARRARMAAIYNAQADAIDAGVIAGSVPSEATLRAIEVV